MLSKEAIVQLLATDDRAVARALIVLNQRQTDDEQATEHTRYHNGQGFRPCHARMGTSMAKFFQRNHYLTPKQIAYWRAKDRTGTMRIAIYWRQLQEAAEIKSQQAVAPAPVDRSFVKDMARRAELEYQYNDVLDSDDPALIDPIKQEMDELDAFWGLIRGNQPL